MILAFLKANPGVAVSSALLIMGLLVSLLFVLLMRTSGQSLRPIAFFLGLFLIIVLPQMAFHLSQAQWPAPEAQETRDDGMAETMGSVDVPLGWAQEHGHILHPALLFGPNAETELIRDARTIFPDMLGQAQAAQMAMYPSGHTLLAARFAQPDEAIQALRGYLAQFQAGPLGGDLGQGIDVPRGAVGDWAQIRLNGSLLKIWTAADAGSLAAFVHSTDEAAPSQSDPTKAAAITGVYIDPRIKQPGMWLFLIINLAVAVVFFFKGAGWAAREPSAPVASPLSGMELVARLKHVNSLDVPMSVQVGNDGREITVDWRLADARWLDLARAHRISRSHRLVLNLDEASHRVRVKEFWRDMDASLGAEGVRAEWKLARGIQFFHHEHQRVFGLQFDSSGRPQTDLSYAYTFNIQELRQPFQQAVRAAGWHWQPVLLDAPAWLRWLTE